MESNDDYYEILGVPKDASEPDISVAYRQLIKKWHSNEDLSNRETAENDLKLIAEAYEVLSDPIKREIYDQQGKKGLVSQTEAASTAAAAAAAAAAVARPAGISDSESGDDGDEDDIWNYDEDRDDMDDLNDMLERFSYGSNYDEDIDDFLNDSNYDEAYGDEGDATSVRDEGNQPEGSNGCNGLSVTEGW